ncbi:hypothetical protein WA026_003740 [Henosepilachna vigintioctopunctata]|uniref:non-specific serine/threonine protein kinase n=1 Tax=Henosepilachna vigintioctopunctata TaxID=420089 RepID=A0AAW1U7H5_9CUCU
MAPYKKLRTYENPKKKNTKPAILTDIVVNLTNIGLCLETSSDISRETTFDRLKKGNNYNNVVLKNLSRPNYSSSGDLSYSTFEYKKNEGYQNESVDMGSSNSNIAIKPSTCEQKELSTNKPDSAIQTSKSLTAHIFKTGFDRSPIVTRSKLKFQPNSNTRKVNMEKCNEKNKQKFLASKENMSFQNNLENNSSSYIISESSTENNSASNNSNKLVRKRKLHNHHFHLNINGFKFKRLRNQCSTPKVTLSKSINKLSAEQTSNICESIEKHINASILNNVKDLSISYKDKNKFKETSQSSNIETYASPAKNNKSSQSICEFDSINMLSQHFDSRQHHSIFQNKGLSSLPSLVLTSTPLSKPKCTMDFFNISSENGSNFNVDKSTYISSKISKLESNNKQKQSQVFEQVNYSKDFNTLANFTKSANCSNALENSKYQDIVDSSIISEQPIMKKYLSLAAGKKFRRSIIIHRNTMDVSRSCTALGSNDIKTNSNFSRRTSIKVVPVTSMRTTIAKLKNFTADSTFPEEDLGDDTKYNSNNHLPLIHISTQDSNKEYNSNDHLPLICRSPKDIVLERCGQTEPLNFDECYPQSTLHNCQKIGEGVYGEVFMYQDQDRNGSVIVMKIIPIEGDQIVNFEKQKTFEEIISEIVITAELSDLRKHKCNRTDAFTEVMKIRCVKGCYPKRLLELWDLYDENKQSENDSPEIFKSDQLYIVLELSNGGRDLEAYEFRNAQQSLSVFNQIACAIAVAEEELHFEHRDLHWGNVLVKVTKEEYSNFILKGREITIKNKEVKATIIDFTLSRIEYDKAVIFNDLALDNDLFSATGDYQFEIYRLMKENNGNEWQSFKPYSNVLWLHYVLDKAITAFRYKNTQSKLHKTSISTLKEYKAKILDYQSVTEFVINNFVS